MNITTYQYHTTNGWIREYRNTWSILYFGNDDYLNIVCYLVLLKKLLDKFKSYISRVENGDIIPSVAKFWEMITSLGVRVEIVKPI